MDSYSRYSSRDNFENVQGKSWRRNSRWENVLRHTNEPRRNVYNRSWREEAIDAKGYRSHLRTLQNNDDPFFPSLSLSLSLDRFTHRSFYTSIQPRQIRKQKLGFNFGSNEFSRWIRYRTIIIIISFSLLPCSLHCASIRKEAMLLPLDTWLQVSVQPRSSVNLTQ